MMKVISVQSNFGIPKYKQIISSIEKAIEEEKLVKGGKLVSLLEVESDYYNTAIVDVSHRFPKMYLVRPQFVIPIITPMNSMQYKAELSLIRNQNIDITNFEDNINKFKEGFAKNDELASRKFNDAIAGIDKTIKEFEKN